MGRGPHLSGMRHILPLLLALSLAAGASAQAPFRVPEDDRLRVVTRAQGWTVLRDVTVPRDRAEAPMVLIRAQRPVPPVARADHLVNTLRNIRAFRFAGLPEAEHVTMAGLPADRLEAHGFGVPSGEALVVRALCLYAPERSWLLIASAPAGQWPAVEPELTRVLEGFRPG